MIRLILILIMLQIKPQPGFQELFLSSSADIVIGGSGAGVGKTYSLLLEPLRHINNKDFGAVIFRRTTPQIRNEGGLWDESEKIYSLIGGKSKETFLTWQFPTGSSVKFAHMEHEKNKYDWQGSQITMIGFDELPHFTFSQFFYMLSRNRSTCGVRPYVRATCNPDPDSWVAELIDWWIEQDEKSAMYGYPIPERVGNIRYFTRENDNFIWGDSLQEVYEKSKHFIDPILKASPDTELRDLIKSLTFIPGDIYDNKELLKTNAGYLANLLALDEDEKLRLLNGNWKIKVGGDDLINPTKLKDVFTNDFVARGKRKITADIAFHGADLFIIAVWEGKYLIDLIFMPKSEPDIVEKKIKEIANKYGVPRSRIAYDADGIGSYLRGYLKDAKPFNGNATPVELQEAKGQKQREEKLQKKENYSNRKTQCYYRLADAIHNDEYFIPEHIANMKLPNGNTVKRELERQRKAVKKVVDGTKLKINSKESQKTYLNGDSPDLLDVTMMNEYLDLIGESNKIMTYGTL